MLLPDVATIDNGIDELMKHVDRYFMPSTFAKKMENGTC